MEIIRICEYEEDYLRLKENIHVKKISSTNIKPESKVIQQVS